MSGPSVPLAWGASRYRARRPLRGKKKGDRRPAGRSPSGFCRARIRHRLTAAPPAVAEIRMHTVTLPAPIAPRHRTALAVALGLLAGPPGRRAWRRGRVRVHRLGWGRHVRREHERIDGPVLGHGPAGDAVDLRTIHRLLLQQQADETGELVPVGADERHRGLLRLAQQPGHLTVDDGLGGFGEWPAGQARPATAAAE